METGILATRLDRTETRFTSYAAAISTFLSGFLVAKVHQVFKAEASNYGKPQLAQLMLFGAGFLLGMLCTFIGRLYVGRNKPDSPLQGGNNR